jgi:hypothetical protein
MAGLCPECASLLYGYSRCEHSMRDGRCLTCNWDGSVSDYCKALRKRDKMSKKSKRSRGGKKSWFAVKSLFRTEITDSPRAIDADYDPDGTLVEERVVLVRTVSHRKALRMSEAEADRYLRPAQHINPYGQRVVWRRVSILNSFKLFERPGDGREVWSLTSVLPSAMSDKELEAQRFGPEESKAMLRRRKKYLNRRYSGDVGLEQSDGGLD